MKYKNAYSVLPVELLELIQEYVQGEYIYIPIRDRCATECPSNYKTELEKRDAHIYTKYLEGLSKKRLSKIYNLSESSIRRIVIKKRNEYTTMNDKINKILFHWGLQNSEVRQIHNTVWQVGEKYVLKVYQEIALLERNLKIISILNEMKIPVGNIVATQEKHQYVSLDHDYFFLSEKLSGNNIVRIGNDRDIALKMGGIIADLHIAFQQCEDVGLIWNNSLLDEMNGWVKEILDNSSWNYISRDEYDKIVDQLAAVYGQLPVQLIHRDVHFGNFLFLNGIFSGYIDFDLSQKNIPIFDICYFLLGLLSDQEKLEFSEELWFSFVKDVIIGYENKLRLSQTEKNAVIYVMECIELLFVAYFESIDDVSSAESAFRIFEFIKKQENRIWRNIR